LLFFKFTFSWCSLYNISM